MKTKPVLLLFALMIFACTAEQNQAQKLKELELLEKEQRILDKKIRALKSEIDYKEEKISLPQVRLIQAERADFIKHLDVNGYVEAIKQASLSPETRGKLQEIYIHEGAKVHKGDLLAKLNTSVIDNTIEEVKANLSLANTVFEKQSRLWQKEIGSEVQFLESKTKKESLEKKIEALKSQRDLHDIRASFDGVIDMIYTKEGEVLNPGAPFAELVQLDQVYAVVDVSEKYITKIRKQDKVRVSFPSLQIKHKEARVLRLSNLINKKNRTFRVEVLLKNKDHEIKPNMMTILSFEEARVKEAISIPNKAVQKDMKGYFVYKTQTSEKGDVVIKKYVKTGLSNNLFMLIEKGVSVGEKIVVDGYNQVSDGSYVEVVQ